MDLPLVSDYTSLFTDDIPLLDVRAPVEFNEGAFPFSVNFPLLSNSERERIGTHYKKMGKGDAIDLGYRLVSGKIKTERVNNWINFAKDNPDGALYCFRGGMRSKICQQWIYEESGIVYPRIEGGYKALRRYLIDILNDAPNQFECLVLSGRTGVGKTQVLQHIVHRLDLEKIFHHRGSAFGKHVDEQPLQINIENTLAVNLLKLRNMGVERFLVEDEAPNIGSRRIPDGIVFLLRNSPIVVLESTLEERVENVYREYILNSLKEYQNKSGADDGFSSWSGNLVNSLQKIHKRLGGERFKNISHLMQNAISAHLHRNQSEAHRDWIRELLVQYYDPMYDYQLSKKKARIKFNGDLRAIIDYIHTTF